MGNKKSHKEIFYDVEEEEDEEFEDEEDIENDEAPLNNKKDNKINSIQDNEYKFPKLNEKKINSINIKEIGCKTNYSDILKSIMQKKPEDEKENELYEKWKISKKNKNDNIFENEEKQGKELLESLKSFLINNEKEFNNILNKYK